MGRRSDFERVDRDYYRTFDKRAGAAIAPHLMPGTRFIEPMAGAYDLAQQMEGLGHTCVHAMDIEPQDKRVRRGDVFDFSAASGLTNISNPMWKRPFLHRLIVHLSDQNPTWLLLDSAWANTVQSSLAKQGLQTVPELMTRCRKIVAVGRLIWIPGTTMSGKDDCSWYLFDRPDPTLRPIFYCRQS